MLIWAVQNHSIVSPKLVQIRNLDAPILMNPPKKVTKSVRCQAYIFNRKPLLFATAIVPMYSILIRQNAPTCECVAQYEDSQPYWIWRNSAKNEFFWVPKLRSICKSSRFALFWYIYFKLNLADFAPKFILLNRNRILASILKSMYLINRGIFGRDTAVQAPL